MEKRGQISIFILMLIVILIMFSFVMFLNNQKAEKSLEKEVTQLVSLSSDALAVKNFIETCVRDVGKDAIYFVSLQGGYYRAPLFNRPYFNIKLPYYWDTANNFMPNLKEIEDEFAAYVDANIDTCLDNFDSLRASGINVEVSQPTTEATVTADNVVFLLSYPLIISKGSTSSSLDSFRSEVDIDFNDFYSMVYQFMASQQENSNVVPISTLSLLAYDNNFKFEYINVGIRDVIFSFIFEIPNDKPLIYGFINTYQWEDVGPSREVLRLQE